MKARLAAVLVSLSSFAAPAGAYFEYPARPVRVVIGASPGDPNDILARVIAPSLTAFFKQPFIVDNHPGANGNLAALRVAAAPADGHTLLVVAAPFATSVSIYPKLGYDPLKSFIPIARLATCREVLIVNSSLGPESLADFTALIRATPGQITIASAGTGTTSHLAAELLKIRAGFLNALHVPYRTNGFALAGLLGGHVHALVATVSSARPHIATGRLRALAVTSRQRTQAFPDLPTLSEAGVYGLVLENAYGIYAPAGVRPAILRTLNREVSLAINAPEARQKVTADGAEPTPAHSPADFKAAFLGQYEQWDKFIRTSGIKLD